MMCSLLMVVVMVVRGVHTVSASQPTVTVGNTTVHGTAVQVGNVTVNYFLGLRFGQPAVGSHRFKRYGLAPLPGGTVSATEYPKSCSAPVAVLPMDEDCLFLSIYAPQLASQEGGEGMPVMVWLYGGSFVLGSGSIYDGGLLAAEGNVVVVTPNYRLGSLGFLSTGDNSSAGNYGLWDQWLALTWIRNYIGHFGGDVTRVTLFGESAGAASVSYHMTSPHSQGLFHRAILHSGSRLCPWALDRKPLWYAQQLGRNLSCTNVDSTSALVSCLRDKPWQSLQPLLPLDYWAPVVDEDLVFPSDHRVIFHGPFMIGVNNREGGMLAPLVSPHRKGSDRRAHVAYVRRTIRQLFPLLAAAASPEEETLAARTADCVYRREGSTDTHVTEEELEEFVGDVEIVLGCQQFVDGNYSTGDAYQYYFDHYPDNIEDGQKGMDHAMELDYTFGFHRGLRALLSPFYNRAVSHRDQLLARRFRTLLTNFAHSGSPNQPAPIPEWPEWPPYTKGEQSYLRLTFSPRVASRLKGERMGLWQDTIPAVLRGQGLGGLNLNRWARCSDLTSHSSSPPAASPVSVVLLVALGACCARWSA